MQHLAVCRWSLAVLLRAPRVHVLLNAHAQYGRFKTCHHNCLSVKKLMMIVTSGFDANNRHNRGKYYDNGHFCLSASTHGSRDTPTTTACSKTQCSTAIEYTMLEGYYFIFSRNLLSVTQCHKKNRL